MTAPTRTRTSRTRGTLVAFAVVAACALACTLPIVGGLLAGGVVGRVFDSPVWVVALASAGTAVAIVAARRRGRERAGGCC